MYQIVAYDCKNKPEIKCDIISALQKADVSIYSDSMQSLIIKDIQNSLKEIEKLSRYANKSVDRPGHL